MAFELPRLVDLTDDQLTILNASYDKNMIVSGAPGTGKSVLAIYRAADLSKHNKRTLLLIYNKPLKLYISSAVNSLRISTEVSTYHAWLFSVYRNILHEDAPQVDMNWDYGKVIEDFKQLGMLYDNIIIDEAQDFPIEMIQALTYVGKSINCFMDVNQRIVSNRYTRYQDIANVLGIKRMYTLSENFRNTEEVYEFAKLYNQNNNDITTTRNGEKPLFVKAPSEDEAYKVIETLILNNSTSTIGIFTNYGEQERVYDRLSESVGSKVSVCAYDSKSTNRDLWRIDFDRSGVFILSTGTMKGLEFDVVIIPGVDKLRGKRDSALNANTFYVAATRASEELYCLYSEDKSDSPFIDVFGPLMSKKDLVDWE